MQLTGVDIMLDENTFKSTYQIIKEISEVWDELTDVTKANVTGLIAGKRNANVVQALMTNFQDAENAMQTAANATGSAFAENEKYIDSIAGRLDILKGQFEAFSQGVINDGTVKFFVTLATKVLEFANALNKVHLLLPAISATIAGIAGKGLVSDVSNLVLRTQAIIRTGGEAAGISTLLTGSLAGLSSAQKVMLADQLQSILETETLNEAYREQIQEVLALMGADSGLAAANQGVAASFSAIWSSLPLVGQIALIVVAFTSIMQMMSGLTKSADDMKEDASKISESFSDAQKQYRDNSKSLKDLSDRYNELSQGIGENGENISLTASEYEEYQNILQQLIDISPGIVSSYDSQGQAVLKYKDALSGAIEEQEKYINNQRDIYIGGGKDLFNGLHVQAQELNNQLIHAGDSLSVALGSGSLGMGYAKVLKEALDAVGGNGEFGLTSGNLKKIYENKEGFLTVLENSGKYSADNIREISMAISELSDEYTALQSVDAQATDWLMEFLKDESWYDNIPKEALDELRTGIDSVTSAIQPFTDNMNNATAYGEEFARVISSDAVRGIREMAAGLADGEGNLDEELEAYHAAVKDFASSFDGTPEVLNQVLTFLLSLTNVLNGGAPAVDNMSASFEGLKEAMDSLKSGYDLLDKAQTEMKENGGLSNDTVKAFQDALEDGEKITDYIYAENDALKLNEEAWEERSRAQTSLKLDNLSEQRDQLLELQEGINTTAETMVGLIEGIDDMTLHETLGEILAEQFGVGSVDLLTRPILRGADMLEAGYAEFADALDDIVTLYSSTFTAGGELTDFQFKDEYGVDIPVVIDVTPVDANGNVLSESELHDYLTELFEVSNDAFGLAMNDAAGKGLILNIEELIASETGSIDWGAAIDAHEIWAQTLHSLSAAFEQANLDEGSQAISDYLFGLIETAWQNPELESQMMAEVYTVLDYLAKALEKKGMPELSEAMSGLNLDNIINGSEAVDNLSETIQLIELLEAMLNSAGANADPLNLVTMFSNLESIGSQASTLVKALEDLDEGNLQDWMDLVSKYPELANVEGLFDIETIEGQKDALMSILDEYEAKYDEVIQDQIDLLQAAKDQQATLEPDADLSAYDTLIENLERMKSFTLSKIFGTKKDVDPLKALNDQLNAFSTAVSNAQSAQSVLDDIAKGEKNDVELLAEVIDLAKKSERPLEEFIRGFDGEHIQFNTEEIEKQVDEFLKVIQELEDAHPDQYGGLTERVKQLIGEGDVEEPLTKLEDAMSRAEKIVDLIKDVEENGVSSGTIKTLQDLFGENWEKYLEKDKTGKYTGLVETALKGVMNSELNLSGATSGLIAIFQDMFQAAADGSEEAKSGIEALTDAISGLKDATSLLSDIRSGNGNPLSMFEKVMDIAKNIDGVNITDLIKFDDDGGFDFSGVESALNDYIESLFKPETLRESLKELFPAGTTDAQIDVFISKLRSAVQAELEATSATDDLKNAISDLQGALSNATTANDVLKDIASGEKNDMELFQEVLQLAETAGVAPETFFKSVDASGINWDLSAIEKARDTFLETIRAFENEHPELTGLADYYTQLMESMTAADTFSQAMGRIKSAMDLVRDSVNNGMSLDLIEKARALFGEDWGKYFTTDQETGEFIGVDTEKVHEFIQAEQEAANIGGAVGAEISAGWEDAANGIEDATSALDGFTSAMSQLQSITNLVNGIQNGTADFTEIINGLVEIAKSGDIPLENLLTFSEGAITPNIEAINAYKESLLSLENLKTVFPNITEEGAAMFRGYVEQAYAAAQATEQFSAALNATSKVKGFVEDAKSGNADFASMLQTASELAQDSGKNVSDFLEVVNGEVQYNTQAAIDWLYSLIDGMNGVNGVTPEMIDAWKQSAAAALESSAAYQAAVDGLNNVTSAIKSSNSGLGLNSEQIAQLTNRYKSLASFNPGELFEKTSQGIVLNTKALQEYESAFQAQEKAMTQSKIDELVQKYKQLADEIKHTSDAEKLSQLFKDQSGIEAQIDALTTYMSQLDALNSKYNKWVQSQSAGEAGDMYDSIRDGLDDIKKLYDENLIGTNKFKAALELMSGVDLSNLNSDQLRELFETTFPTMTRWFTEGTKGLNNFLNDLEKIGMASKDVSGNWSLDVDIDQAAKELGVSTDIIIAALKKLQDNGFDIDIDFDEYESGIDKAAADIEAKFDEIANAKAALDAKLQSGEISQEQYDTLIQQLDAYQKKLEELKSSDTEIEEPEPISLEEALQQIETLKSALETLANSSIEIPVTITGDRDLLAGLLGGNVGEGGEAGTVELGLVLNSDEYDNYDPEEKEVELHLVPTVDDDDDGSYTPEDTTMSVTADLDSSEPDSYNAPDKDMQVTAELDSSEPDDYTPEDQTATLTYEAQSTDMTFEAKSSTVTFTKDSSEVDSYTPEDKSATAEYDVDDAAVKSYTPSNKSATVNYKPDFSACRSATPPTLSGKVKYKADMSGVHNARGTVHGGTANSKGTAQAEGTAFRSGKYALKHDVVALSGELGPELVVRDGRFFTVGNAGAQFFKFKSGDIIFNASQTEELLKTGLVRSFGGRGVVIGDRSAYATGTAFAKATGSGKLPDSKGSGGNKKKKGGGGSKGSTKATDTGSDKSDDSDYFDWIEVLIDRIEAKIKSLARIAESSFKVLTTRLGATDDEIAKVNKEMSKLKDGYDRYIKQANKVNLSEDLKKKVREGKIDINKYSGDKLDKIKEYQEWYEKALDAKYKIEELQEDMSELYQDKFEATQKDYENKIAQQEHTITTLEKNNAAAEYTAASRDFGGIRSKQEEKLKLLNEEAATLQKRLNEAVQSGTIEEGSEAWYDMVDAIAKVNETAQETATAIAKSYKDAFDDVERQYKNTLSLISNEITKINNQISASEFSGSGADYSALRKEEEQRLTMLNAEAVALKQKLDEALYSGKIAEGSDAWYDMKNAIAAVEDEAQQTATDIARSYKDAFDYVEKRYQNSLSMISHAITDLNNQMSASEYNAAEKDFNALRKQQEANLSELNREASALQARLDEAVRSGKIAMYSDAWYDMTNAIASVREEAQQTAIEIAKTYKDAFNDMERQYKLKLSTISNELAKINNQIAASEYTAATKDYAGLRKQQQATLDMLNKEADALQKKLDEAVNSGKIKVGSEAWYDMRDAIASVRDEAEETAIDIAKSYKDAFDSVEEIYKDKLTMLSHAITNVNNQISASEYNGSAKNYAELRKQQQNNINLLNEEVTQLQKKLNEAVNSGKIKEGSSAWYEMKEAIASASEEAQQMAIEIAKSYKDAFDDIETRYSALMSNLENKTKTLQNGFDMIEAKGYLGGKKLYEQMAAVEQQTINTQKAELKELEKALNDAVKSGKIAAGSEAWYDMKDAIDDVKLSIQDAEIELIEYNNKIRDLDWSIFDYLQDRIGGITDEADFLIELMERSGLFDDNGAITEAGNAALGLHAVRYNVMADQVQQYTDAISELNDEIAKSPDDTELIERREKLLKLQRDSVLAAENEKKAVADLIEDGINKELKALKELIEKYNDGLSSAKGLYDYQKKVSKQADNIASLQKQIAAYSGDMSEETRAKLQKLEVELKTANEDLQEMQYDQYISDQKVLLDNLYDDYEEILNARLDDVNALMAEIIESSNSNSSTIRDTIVSECKAVGITMTETMDKIWSPDGQYGAVVTTLTNGIPDQLTTVIGALKVISNRVASIVNAGNATANTYVNGMSGFAKGGFVSGMKKAAYRNGDDIVTFNSLKEGEAVLTQEQAAQFKALVNHLPALQSMMDVGQQIRTMNHVTPSTGNIDVGGFNMTFQIDHVQDYNDLVRQMRNDKTFERMIKSITLDPLVGKSTLNKRQYYNQ